MIRVIFEKLIHWHYDFTIYFLAQVNEVPRVELFGTSLKGNSYMLFNSFTFNIDNPTVTNTQETVELLALRFFQYDHFQT